MTETIVQLDLECRPEAAVSGAVLVQTESRTILTFNAVRRMSDGFDHPAGTALVEFPGCCVSRFGYPNDEAWSAIPRTRGLAYGIFEVLGSEWKRELTRLNRFAFPGSRELGGRHFLILFHDSSFECIADDIRLEVINEPYHEVFARVGRRVLGG